MGTPDNDDKKKEKKGSKLYARLEELTKVEVPRDIVASGMGAVSQALGDIQKNTMICARFAVRVVDRLKLKKKIRNAKKAVLDVKMSQLLASDEEVKKGKSGEARNALAAMKLKKERIEFEKAEMEFRDVESDLIAVEYVLSALKHSKEIAGRQLEVVQKEMDLGLITPGSFKQED